MKTQVVITHSDGKELTKGEIENVLQILHKHKDTLPPVGYEYRQPSKLFGTRQSLYLIPKDETQFPYIQVQNILDQEFPGEYVAETL